MSSDDENKSIITKEVIEKAENFWSTFTSWELLLARLITFLLYVIVSAAVMYFFGRGIVHDLWPTMPFTFWSCLEFSILIWWVS